MTSSLVAPGVFVLGLVAAAPLPAAAAAPDRPPVVYAQKTRGYDVELRIDPALKAYGGIYADDRDETLRGFNAFEREADQLRAFQPVSGGRPLVERVEYVVTCITPHLIGVIRRDYQDRHGAHPAYAVQGFILDRSSGHRLGASDLLKPGVDMAPFDAALQAAIDTAKHVRHGNDPVPTPPGSSLPTWDSGRPAIRPRNTPPTDATLTPAASGDAAAGLQFLYGPYDAGAYSDGAYRVVLPDAVFAAALKPQYARDFAGEPAPQPDDPIQGFPADVTK